MACYLKATCAATLRAPTATSPSACRCVGLPLQIIMHRLLMLLWFIMGHKAVLLDLLALMEACTGLTFTSQT